LQGEPKKWQKQNDDIFIGFVGMDRVKIAGGTLGILSITGIFVVAFFPAFCFWKLLSIIGWGIFLTALLFFHWHAEAHGKTGFDQGQIRRAILISIMFIFFAFLTRGGEIVVKEKTLSYLALSRFDLIFFVILGFYFGGRALREGLEAWKQSGLGRNSQRN